MQIIDRCILHDSSSENELWVLSCFTPSFKVKMKENHWVLPSKILGRKKGLSNLPAIWNICHMNFWDVPSPWGRGCCRTSGGADPSWNLAMHPCLVGLRLPWRYTLSDIVERRGMRSAIAVLPKSELMPFVLSTRTLHHSEQSVTANSQPVL